MNIFTRQLRTVVLVAALAVVMAVTLSCSKKCGDKVYDAKTQFCCNNRDIVDKCGGGEYDPEKQFCHENSIVEKCGGKEYDLATQFCYNNSILADKCGGEEYNAETKFCFRDKILDKCGSSTYNPETQFCDTRDNSVYAFVKIQKQTWMAENLHYKVDKSWCYENNDSKCQQYGRLYDWNAAKTACPAGWHLPSDADWGKLRYLKGDAGAGKMLKSTAGWSSGGNGTDKFGFNALPGGIRSEKGEFFGDGSSGNWWTAAGHSANQATFYLIESHEDEVYAMMYGRSSGASVRCVAN